MESILKTKDVSQVLGVNPTTVQRWVKFFNIPCEKNKHGHYLFNEKNIAQLKEIKELLNQGLSMSQIKITKRYKKHNVHATYNVDEVVKKFNSMTKRIENVENQLDEKATDVVNIQILQHRRELEKLHQLVENMKQEIIQLKAHIEKNKSQQPYNQKQKPVKNWLASFLNLL